jgi:hypothetical protein
MDLPAQPPDLPAVSPRRLTSYRYIAECLTHEAAWHQSHGAGRGFLGSGMLYYAFAYTLRAKVAVCLGSGGGFVPRVLRQVQRDLALPKSVTYLVDANRPEAGWGSPQWLAEESFFRKEFPDVEVIFATTTDAFHRIFVPQGLRIDYLHIDADHSYEACLEDYEHYRSLMAESFAISIHDTDTPTVARVIDELRKLEDVELIDFPDIGHGAAFVRPRLPATAPKLYWARTSEPAKA